MRQIYGMFILNIKILLSEKIVLLWTTILPIIIFVMSANRSSLENFNDQHTFIAYFWSFIILSTFFNGVGIHIMKLRDLGLLKTYTLISGNKRNIVFGIILSQLIISALSIMIFSIVVTLIYQIDVFTLTLAGMTLLLCIFIPISIISLILTIIPIRHTSLSTILNILLYILFIMSLNHTNIALDTIGGVLNIFNPFNFILDVNILILSFMNVSDTISTLNYYNFYSIVILCLLGIISYKKLNLVSMEYRS